jgi:hypothetical protein
MSPLLIGNLLLRVRQSVSRPDGIADTPVRNPSLTGGSLFVRVSTEVLLNRESQYHAGGSISRRIAER